MAFIDWTFNVIAGNGACALDASIKYAGASSAKISIADHVNAPVLRLTHDTFSEPRAQVIGWSRIQIGESGSTPRGNVYHSSYGSIDTLGYATDITWEKFRSTFWYDIDSDTKWGRLDKWVASAWVQQGTDINFGTGSPSAGAISLEGKGVQSKHSQVVWFDEVEIFS